MEPDPATGTRLATLWASGRAALGYFAAVFGAGFLLGVLRVGVVVPRLGERWAELLEMPVMVLVILLSARRLVRPPARVRSPRQGLGVGLVALGLMLAAELLLAVALQARSLAEYLASRDPVSGSVYLGMLLMFALMPALLARRAAERG